MQKFDRPVVAGISQSICTETGRSSSTPLEWLLSTPPTARVRPKAVRRTFRSRPFAATTHISEAAVRPATMTLIAWSAALWATQPLNVGLGR